MSHSQAHGNRRRLPVESLKLILDDVAGNPLGMWRLDEEDGLWVDEDGRGLDIDEVKEAVLGLVKEGGDVS